MSMQYFLQYHFDPEFDYRRLKPRAQTGKTVNHYNLGYVQNVSKGEVLAQWIEKQEDSPPAKPVEPGAPAGAPEGNTRQVPGPETGKKIVSMTKKIFPAGKNTAADPDNPDRLIALITGYVYMEEGKICVKSTLNVRRTVDFNTGNIYFNSDVVVHGGVRPDFQVHATSIVVKGTVDAAVIRARKSLIIHGGVKGAGKALLSSGHNMRASFVENATLRVGNKLTVDTACMHSEVYAGDQLVVKGKLVGGETVCSRLVYVGKCLGGGMGVETSITLGYDAGSLYLIRFLEERMLILREKLEELHTAYARHTELGEEFESAIIVYQKKLKLLDTKRKAAWETIAALKNLEGCGVLCPGEVVPGVRVTVGPVSLQVTDYLKDVRFEYRDMNIIVSSPAMK